MPQRKFLKCVELINHWPESACLDKAGKIIRVILR